MAGRGTGNHGDLIQRLERWQLALAYPIGDIQFSRDHGLQHRVLIGEQLEFQSLVIDLKPVIHPPREMVSRLTLFGEVQWSIGNQIVLLPPIVTIFLERMSGYRGETRICQDEREIVGSFFQFYFQCSGVDCFDPQIPRRQFTILDRFGIDDVVEQIGGLLLQLQVGLQDALKSSDEVRRVDGSAIAPRDAGPQVETISQTIVGNVPRLGLGWLQLASFVEQEQGLEQRLREHHVFHRRGVCGVERLGRFPQTDAKCPFGRRGRVSHQEKCNEQASHHVVVSSVFHIDRASLHVSRRHLEIDTPLGCTMRSSTSSSGKELIQGVSVAGEPVRAIGHRVGNIGSRAKDRSVVCAGANCPAAAGCPREVQP